MRNSAIFMKIQKDKIRDIGECELCGSKRNLELHHIIPCVLYECEEEDNFILLCQKCHTFLTPKRILTKIGIEKVKNRNMLNNYKIRILEKFNERIESGDYVSSDLVYALADSIEEVTGLMLLN